MSSTNAALALLCKLMQQALLYHADAWTGYGGHV